MKGEAGDDEEQNQLHPQLCRFFIKENIKSLLSRLQLLLRREEYLPQTVKLPLKKSPAP